MRKSLFLSLAILGVAQVANAEYIPVPADSEALSYRVDGVYYQFNVLSEEDKTACLSYFNADNNGERITEITLPSQAFKYQSVWNDESGEWEQKVSDTYTVIQTAHNHYNTFSDIQKVTIPGTYKTLGFLSLMGLRSATDFVFEASDEVLEIYPQFQYRSELNGSDLSVDLNRSVKIVSNYVDGSNNYTIAAIPALPWLDEEKQYTATVTIGANVE